MKQCLKFMNAIEELKTEGPLDPHRRGSEASYRFSNYPQLLCKLSPFFSFTVFHFFDNIFFKKKGKIHIIIFNSI